MNRRLPPPGGSGRSYNINHNLIRQVQQRSEPGGEDAPDPKATEYHYHQHFSAAPAAVTAEPPRKSSAGKIAAIVIGCIFVLLILIGIGSAENASEEAGVDGDVSAQAMSEPSPNYTEHRNGVYYYPSAISENAKADGIALAAAIGFRYLGVNADGEHVLAPMDSPGVEATCADPCRVIHTNMGEALTFTPNSVIGAAFIDAINGFLQEHPGSVSAGPASYWETDAAAAAADAAAAAADAAGVVAEAALADVNAAAAEAEAASMW